MEELLAKRLRDETTKRLRNTNKIYENVINKINEETLKNKFDLKISFHKSLNYEETVELSYLLEVDGFKSEPSGSLGATTGIYIKW